ncbi:MAG: hypothetical protein OER86_14555, partial [Phycisphaerae bacterium]|nr:hypothetical protein [Phycisphaerae bacterium]
MRFLAALVLVVLLLGSSASAADEAGELFNSIYGARLRQVRATVSAADDLVLAEELLAAARTSQDAPAILVILCDNAYALARKGRDGLGTAIEAAEFLGARVPEKRIESLEKVRQIRQRLYLAARGAEKAAQGEALIGSLLALAEAAKQTNDLDGAVAHGRRALTTATAIKSRRRARIQADLDELIVRQQIGKREARWKDRLKANP